LGHLGSVAGVGDLMRCRPLLGLAEDRQLRWGPVAAFGTGQADVGDATSSRSERKSRNVSSGIRRNASTAIGLK